MLAPNALLQNRYQIIRSIGHGGMGAVYLARDQRLGHTVALKETFFTEERMRRAFEREARLLAHLRHPALPKVTDHFDEDGGQFIVMEFISGEDLEILLAERGEPFAVEQVLMWADELLKALAYLHSQDPPILHRDIKPANLKLTPQGEIILLDFGLAKGTAGQTSSVMTSRSVFGFTPNFAPLEQIQGTGTGPRSDLYALAATLYYLMTGAIPPDALTRITEVANGQTDPLHAADEVNAQVPRAVAELLMKTMAHNRDHRPESAAEMRRLLREAYPALADLSASRMSGGANVKGAVAERAMSSTIIEMSPTEEIPAAVETAASPTSVSPTVEKPAPELQTAPVETPAPLAEPERRVRRLPWAIAGVAALLLVAVTIGLIKNLGADKAVADTGKADSVVAKDAASTGASTIPVSEQSIVAPDNSEIITTNAGGLKIETRTFKSHPRVSKVVVTNDNGKTTARIFFVNGDERELPESAIPSALEAGGDQLASAAGLMDEKAKPAQGAKVAVRKANPPLKSQSPKTDAQQKLDSKQSIEAPNQAVTPDQFSKRVSQQRGLGAENVVPMNRTAEGAKKSSTKP
ncbi:MAG TPA: protein kinase [Pyrinomonadaceae bacterium]|nr:protein kinase [Pyrinomonadaceae bacterium]